MFLTNLGFELVSVINSVQLINFAKLGKLLKKTIFKAKLYKKSKLL